MKRKIIFPGLVLLLALVGAATLMATSPHLEPTIPEPVATSVRVLKIDPAPVTMQVHSQGTALPLTETDLVPEVSGRVTWISPNVVTGGYFENNEVLLRIDSRDYQSTVSRARATLTRAQAEQEHAQFELARMKTLEERKLASKSQLENALRTARIEEAGFKDATLALQQAERDLARTEIRAPFTGLVRSKQVDQGQFISRGSMIAGIYATDYVEVRLPIADSQLAYLNLPLNLRGEIPAASAPAVTLTANFAGREYKWHGTLVRTEAEIDMKTRMVNAVARVENTGNSDENPPLRVGQFVNASIQGRSADGIVVLPRSSIRNNSQVLIVDDDNRLHYRTVHILRIYGDKVYVDAGLQAGERVCVSVLQTVVEGMRVRPVSDIAVETGPAVNQENNAA